MEPEVPVSTAAFALVSEEVRKALPDEVEDAYPLSRLQAGMLYQGELGGTAGVYHDVIAYLLELPFAEEALRGALDEVSARHAVLRTAFELTTFGDPLQLVYRDARVPLQVHDLRGAAEGEAALARVLDEARRRPFDWTEAPLVRAHAVRVSEERFHLVLDFHHAVLDGVERGVAVHGAGAALPGAAAGKRGGGRSSCAPATATSWRWSSGRLADPAESMFWDASARRLHGHPCSADAGHEGTGDGVETGGLAHSIPAGRAAGCAGAGVRGASEDGAAGRAPEGAVRAVRPARRAHGPGLAPDVRRRRTGSGCWGCS